MSQAGSAEGADRSGELAGVAIPRVSVDDAEPDYAGELNHPLIYTDALADWPATGKWSIQHFAKQYGDHFGLIPMSFFDGSSGKAVSLRDYLSHLDDKPDHTPGFWVDAQGLPLSEAPGANAPTWAFYWRAFRDYPELYDDLGPYPEALGNLADGLPRDVADMLEAITKRDFFSLYISRKGTITPLHADFHETTGSLAQFEGTKQVTLIEPDDDDTQQIAAFDPANPDLAAFPQLRGRRIYRDHLRPGQLLIIPPKWWHHVRSVDHTLTLSHNFFAPHNLAAYLRGILGDIGTGDMKAFRNALAQLSSAHSNSLPGIGEAI